jgi:class 3 adenylate cyclase
MISKLFIKGFIKIRYVIRSFLQNLLQLLYRRTILVLSLLCGLGISAALWNFAELSHNIMTVQALENAQSYAKILQEARTLYSDEVVPPARKAGMEVTHNYSVANHAIPLPATYLIELGERVAQHNQGMLVRLYSHYPFPWRKATGGVRDSFEEEAVQFLEKNPQSIFFRSENYEGRWSFRYAQADIMKASCIHCHNTHPQTPKNDWKVGDVRGVLEIIQPLNEVSAEVNRSLRGTSVFLGLMGAIGVSGLVLVIGKLRNTSRELELKVKERTLELSIAKEKSENLLLNILPEPIADRLKEGSQQIADGFAMVSILFADIVGFTELSQQFSPDELVRLLNALFSRFDQLSDQYQLEKIKTIGDAYMVAGGIPFPTHNHAESIAEMALSMLKAMEEFNSEYHTHLDLRIGINSGPVTAGVIGQKKFIYDLWGDAVNTASRMESHGVPGTIQVTETTYHLLRDQYHFVERGTVQIKGKGEMLTYFLQSRLYSTLT